MNMLEYLIKDRKAKKIKQKEVAQAIGCTQFVISRIESGKSKPYYEFIVKYAEFLGYKLKLEVNGI